jgi:Holliday junction resolvasome RuvABC endonuclease subunit
MSVINLLGIDPSLTNTGYAVIAVDTATMSIVRVVEIGLIETAPTKVKSVRKSSDDLARARTIIEQIRAVIAKHNIKVGTSEIPSGAQSANAAKAFGIVIGMLASLPIPLIEVTPNEVKLATCGNKIADKEDIVRWAITLPIEGGVGFPCSRAKNEWMIEVQEGYISKKAEHPADACGTVAAALATQQFRQLAGMLAALIS